MVIDGREISKKIISNLKNQPKPNKTLAAFFVGERPDSASFLKQKEKMAGELGIGFKLYKFPETMPESDLISEITKAGVDPQIGGMIVQLPLPEKFNRDAVIAAIPPEKDVDALTLESQKLVDPLPVAVVKDILGIMNYELRSKKVAVVGKGFLVGKPIIEWLMGSPSTGSGQKCQSLLIFDSKSDLADLKNFDLVITGVGKAGLIKPDMLKNGAGVIDFGYSFKSESGIMNKELSAKVFGDFDTSDIHNSSFIIHNSGFYTPTPGGTGPILVAEIFKNFYRLNKI